MFLHAELWRVFSQKKTFRAAFYAPVKTSCLGRVIARVLKITPKNYIWQLYTCFRRKSLTQFTRRRYPTWCSYLFMLLIPDKQYVFFQVFLFNFFGRPDSPYCRRQLNMFWLSSNSRVFKIILKLLWIGFFNGYIAKKLKSKFVTMFFLN